VTKDDVQAVAWYRRAAEQGLPDAQTNLGTRYASGQGVAQDPVQAVAWFSKAADHGDMSAAFNLGVMYANGTGVAADPIEAYKWIDVSSMRASGEDRKRAAAALQTLHDALTPAQLIEGEKRAREWLEQHR
jgi:hypothetical protein